MINNLVLEAFKTPEELHKHMNEFVYGTKLDNGKTITPDDKEWDDDLHKHLRISNPDELEQHHHGTCYDQSIYAHQKLKEMGYHPKTIFMMKKIPGGYNSHMTTFYKDKDGYKNFEHAWHQYSGIHGPHQSYHQAVNHYVHHWSNDDSDIKLNSNVNIKKLLNEPDLDSDTLFNHVNKKSKIIKNKKR